MRSVLRSIAAVAFVLFASQAFAQSPAPEKVVTLADVQSVLGGKFVGREVEPGIYNYEEDGGPRVVQVSLEVDPGKTVPDMKAMMLANSETVDDVTGVGDAALYRPQGFCAMTEKKNKSGQLMWLEIRVHNVEGASAAADTKRFAVELAKRGAARL